MSEESINSILNSSGDYEIALLTTFNLDIDFFERGILSILLKRGIRKVSLFVDARQLAESVNSVSRCHLGSDYMIHPISVNGAFHPKVILLLGERKARVIVSSANLTVNGYFSNGEVFSAIDYDADHPEGLSAVHSAIALFEELNSRYSHEYDLPLFEEIRALWYYGKAGVEKDRALITNLNEPLLSQIKARINSVSTIDIAVPYYDNELSALKFLANAFPAAKIKLYLQNKKCRIPNDLLRSLPNIRCIVFDEYNVSAKQSRRSFYHGKVICFSSDNRSIAVYGSANCTRSALQLTPSTGGNVECVLVDYGHASEFSAFFKNFTPTNAKLEGDVLSFDDPPTNTFSFMYGILKPGWVEAELHFSCVKIVPVIDASFHGNTLNYEWIGRTLIVKLPVDEYSPVGVIFDIDLAFEGSTNTIKCWIIDLSRLAMFRANSAMSLSREFDLSGSGDQYVDDMRVLLSALTFTPEELDAREKVFIAVEGQSMSDEETDDMDEGGIISYTPPPLEEVELYRLYKRVDKVFAQRLIHLESSTIKALDPSKVSAIKECKDATIGSIPSKRRATNAEQSFLRYYKRRLSDLLSFSSFNSLEFKRYFSSAEIFLEVLDKYSLSEYVEGMFSSEFIASAKCSIICSLLEKNDSQPDEPFRELLINSAVESILKNRYVELTFGSDGTFVKECNRDILLELENRFRLLDSEDESIQRSIISAIDSSIEEKRPTISYKTAVPYIEELYGCQSWKHITELIKRDYGGDVEISKTDETICIIAVMKKLVFKLPEESKIEIVKYACKNNIHRFQVEMRVKDVPPGPDPAIAIKYDCKPFFGSARKTVITKHSQWKPETVRL